MLHRQSSPNSLSFVAEDNPLPPPFSLPPPPRRPARSNDRRPRGGVFPFIQRLAALRTPLLPRSFLSFSLSSTVFFSSCHVRLCKPLLGALESVALPVTHSLESRGLPVNRRKKGERDARFFIFGLLQSGETQRPMFVSCPTRSVLAVGL